MYGLQKAQKYQFLNDRLSSPPKTKYHYAMKFAFCLFNYYPFGGLERDFLRIANTCLARGHRVHVFTMGWRGERVVGLEIHLVPVSGLTNHRRAACFAKRVAAELASQDFDAVVGFNRMPGLDVYYAADICYATQARAKHGAWYRYTPRYRHYIDFERTVFAPPSPTKILLLAAAEQQKFIQNYGTPLERFHLLPPGIDPQCKAPANVQEIRTEIRKQWAINETQSLILMVGSDFKRKGVDRALYAIAALPQPLRNNTWLLIAGEGNCKPYQALAKKLAISHQVRFLGGYHQVERLMWAANLLLHPAYSETAGIAILEAIVAGLPVLVTDHCGYAVHVDKARAGLLVSSPFKQDELNQKLHTCLSENNTEIWRKNALNYAAVTDLYHLPERATDIIEQVAINQSKAVT